MRTLYRWRRGRAEGAPDQNGGSYTLEVGKRLAEDVGRRGHLKPSASATRSGSLIADDLLTVLTDLLQATGTRHGYSLRLLGGTH